LRYRLWLALCEYGYGAVLEQSYEDTLRPLSYFSKSYTVTQRKYATSEKELLAVVMAVEHFHQYLYGKQFTVYTDHLPLTWLLNKKNPHHRLERWLLRLSLYNLVIAYKPGKENLIADFLSRLPEEIKKFEETVKKMKHKISIMEEEIEAANQTKQRLNSTIKDQAKRIGDMGSENQRY
jgi:hypothetical protein